MRVIPVIDLMNGQVVRGIAGRRSEYRPIESRIAANAQPATVARAFVEQFGFDTAYVADLDAIVNQRPSEEAWKTIVDAGLKIWLDAGVGTRAAAVELNQRLCRLAIEATIIVGLESLVAPAIVAELLDVLGAANIVLSLDLRQGKPITRIVPWQNNQPIEIARWLIDAGIERLIVLDLADVGTASGTGTLTLCREIHRQWPHIDLTAGGGIRGIDDLRALANAGCAAALVASALHDERLKLHDIISSQCSS
jgi:phosphoribosylformimino-5-aminoimidazole carboxamide ribotide isomerase